ncbi:MAG: hypothetical protein IJ121_08025 [Eubacterium sp.]|nr:hypothetical protein [Eubacterium sp.]
MTVSVPAEAVSLLPFIFDNILTQFLQVSISIFHQMKGLFLFSDLREFGMTQKLSFYEQMVLSSAIQYAEHSVIKR